MRRITLTLLLVETALAGLLVAAASGEKEPRVLASVWLETTGEGRMPDG